MKRLIFDGDSCHFDNDVVDAGERNDLIIYCLPSNTTSELQPLDKTVNKFFENYWDQKVMKFMYHNPTKKLNRARFNAIFTKVWAKSLTPENLINGFKATELSIYPFYPNAISEDAFAPSLLTETALHRSGNVDCGMNLQRINNSDTDITDDEDSTAHRSLSNPDFSPSINTQNDSDIDAMNIEDARSYIESMNTMVSPSLLISTEPFALSPQTCSSKPQVTDELLFYGR
ncbi:hypothetical protein ABMA28_003484 [Loxostege sticticalis]|uniref:DDE-1 domain-containing protein n=1 Tax=Loxostege sticticalis TaxID=481309 RepID=A0ABD0SW86_LOXSC